MLHYAPSSATIEGEPVGIWPFLGTDRLAAPIIEHEPDLVVHGHAHAGTFAGSIERVPVYNVSLPVIERDFWVFELDPQGGSASGIH
jgi:Icc-related predicted phosphoesterase